MKREFTITALVGLTIIALFTSLMATPSMAPDGGATQISGLAVYAAEGECTDPEGDGSDYVVTMSGDLVGCHYTFVEFSRCTPGGAYFESGTETFVGSYNGGTGTFGTNYVFTAVYKNCTDFIAERAGRCQHPIAAGSGTGVFEGVSGRIDMRDDVEAGNFPWRGHLMFGDSLNLSSGRSLDDSPGGLPIVGGGC